MKTLTWTTLTTDAVAMGMVDGDICVDFSPGF